MLGVFVGGYRFENCGWCKLWLKYEYLVFVGSKIENFLWNFNCEFWYKEIIVYKEIIYNYRCEIKEGNERIGFK